MIIEAIYENIDVKVETFKKMDAVAKPGAVLASNTSGLDIDKMAAATSRPEAVIGLHFFSPANVMKLLEIVRGENTSKEVIATSMKLGRTLNKIAVLSGNAPGFIGNRMLAGYTRRRQVKLFSKGRRPIRLTMQFRLWYAHGTISDE